MLIPKLDSRARRVASAIVSSLAGRVATLVAPFLATPAMLNYFGDTEFGLWATAISFTSIAVIADLGIGNGMLTRISEAYGRSDNSAIRRYASSAFAVVISIALAMLVISAISFLIFGGSLTVLMVFVAFIIGMPGASFYQMLYALQRVPTANAIQTAGAAGAVGAALLAVHLSLPVWFVVLAYAIPPVTATYVAAAIFFIRHPEYRPSIRKVDRIVVRDLLGLGTSFFVLSILTAVTMNIDNIVISSRVGTEAVAAFSIPMRLGSLLGLAILAIYMPMWGANGEAIARGEYRWVRKSAIRMSVVGGAFVLTSGLTLIAISDLLIHLWVGRTFEDQTSVLAGFVFLSTVIAVTSPFNMVLNAMGRVSVQIWPWLLTLLVTAVAKSLLVPSAVWLLPSITGVAYALVITPVMIISAMSLLKSETTSRSAGA